MIPETYEAWRTCIERDCGIRLTTTFVQERIAVLSDAKNAETKRFAALYGEFHLARVLDWYRQSL